MGAVGYGHLKIITGIDATRGATQCGIRTMSAGYDKTDRECDKRERAIRDLEDALKWISGATVMGTKHRAAIIIQKALEREKKTYATFRARNGIILAELNQWAKIS